MSSDIRSSTGEPVEGPFERHSYRVRFDGGNGFELAGIIDRPRERLTSEPLADAPVAVFSHCFTCSKDLKAIARISRRLAELGVAVLRFDMTGLGGSDGDFSRTHFTSNQADLKAAVQFAGTELGAVTGLIGHSFGGAASLAVASDEVARPHSLKAVVAIAAPSDTVHLANLLDRMNPKIQEDGIGEVEIGGRRWSIRREMLDDFRSHQLADQLPNIQSHVMAFHSPSDETVGYDHALRIASLISGEDDQPGCSVVTLAGADHLLIRHPGDAILVADTAAAFLNRHR
ncbi:alpha/beta hydrolase family protein [Rhodopirellula bahusiensis]|uniref:Alpha/beta hydrolase n=1 Tax=Rhodopirellula bahusiensis TaxID=2014065 RepID=A0A2G1W6K0_9BACT|nr:alpha/beta fold hydrolase [Rhodopirellula bahusiensis]PHQ34648.1 alpha/beta hydrolase [Rhodopirellula bahusiensis]